MAVSYTYRNKENSDFDLSAFGAGALYFCFVAMLLSECYEWFTFKPLWCVG